MITIMSTDAGAVALQGSTSSVTGVASPQAAATRGLISVIRDVVSKTHIYHHEEEVNAALRALTAYEKAFITPSERRAFDTSNDPAEREDVRTRTAASMVQAAVGPNVVINYDLLAQALVRAQAAHDLNQNPPVNVITDVPATHQGE